MRKAITRRVSAVVLAGMLAGAAAVAVAPAATAESGVCGTYGAYTAKNSKCSYNIQSYSRYNSTYTYGNKAGFGKTSSQGKCMAYTTYGVYHRV